MVMVEIYYIIVSRHIGSSFRVRISSHGVKRAQEADNNIMCESMTVLTWLRKSKTMVNG